MTLNTIVEYVSVIHCFGHQTYNVFSTLKFFSLMIPCHLKKEFNLMTFYIIHFFFFANPSVAFCLRKSVEDNVHG